MISYTHHKGIRHLTPEQLQLQLGLIKEPRKGASLPQWKLAGGIGLLLKHTKFINVLFLLHSISNNLI